MVIRALAHGAFCLSLVSMAAPSISETFPGPEGLKPCPVGDPVAAVEARIAARIGGTFLSCFRSDPNLAATPPAQQASTPTEYAFAITLHDHEYTVDNLNELRSKTEQQWKDFQPLDGNLTEAYVAKLNDSLRGDRKSDGIAVKSVQPLLVKISRDHKDYYTVTSIRTYGIDTGDGNVSIVKVNADAMVLRGSKLIRLTIQRTLTGAADVARVQAEIDRWATMVA